ncbi:MAG: [FeFe] hydrogenase, group A [Kiritimatiellaeota bacterium]|nr:[FeFe] hydrogenase, group A [Kiritimatiellota bacterium]
MKRRTFLKTTASATLFSLCPRLCRAADDIEHVIVDPRNPAIMHNIGKCASCGDCLHVCKNEMGVWGSFDLTKTKSRPICTHCGQCTAVCTYDAVTERPEQKTVNAAITDPDTFVVVFTSPAVRVSLGEVFGAKPGTNVEGQLVAALRKLGANAVFDTTFGADLTVMEEASELLQRVTAKRTLPQFTSCCPAWVTFAETFYPELIPNLSTAKSPIGMQGSVIKTWFAEKRNLNPKRIFAVALTPCTAKKFEIRRDEMNVDGVRATDAVMTIRELGHWLKQAGINPLKLDPEPYDDLMGRGSGASVIFGNTGGVTEATLRTAYFLATKEPPPPTLLAYEPVRGMDGVRSAQVAALKVSVAIVHGTANARKLIATIKAGDAHYDFIEVMACRGGCIGGGGQPKTAIPMTDAIRQARIQGLYALDTGAPKRLSHENPQVQTLYTEFLDAPLSAKAHRLLHTTYVNRSADLG